MTREIRDRIVEARAYYMGRSARVPAHLLSEVFDPARGPSIGYFVQTLRTINRTRFIGRHCRTATFREFQRSSEAALEELRLLANQMAMCLGVPDKTDRRHSVGQALKISVYFFRVASGRFFRQLSWSGSLLRILLRNRNNVGMGIYVADRLLNDIAKAFEVRERQLRGEPAAVPHEFFTSQHTASAKEADDHRRILAAIEKVNRNQLLSHKFERQLLRRQDSHDGRAGRPAEDARCSTPVRAAMVQLTALRIYNSRASDANAIKFSFFKAFRPIPDAYDKYNSFSRAVDRTLRTYLS